MATLIASGCSSVGSGKGTSMQPSATVEVAVPVKMSNEATATISGKGFKPGQELIILFTANDGLQSDIGYALKPAPKGDSSGAWRTTWKCGHFIAKKLVKAGGSYKITVTDSEFNPIAHTFVKFIK